MLVEKDIQKIYVWKDVQDWQPWENTLLYLPMTDDLLDHSSHWITITNNNSVTVVNDWVATIKSWYFGWAIRKLTWTLSTNINSAFTVNVWWKLNWTYNKWFYTMGGGSKINWTLHLWYSTTSRWLTIAFYWNDDDTNSNAWTDNIWHLFSFTYTPWSDKIYMDWVLFHSWSLTWLNTSSNNFMIWDYIVEPWYWFPWYMSKFIIENRARTAQEVSDNYNLTKHFDCL